MPVACSRGDVLPGRQISASSYALPAVLGMVALLGTGLFVVHAVNPMLTVITKRRVRLAEGA